MRKVLLTLAFVLSFATPNVAAAMAIDVSSDVIRVTTGFTGATITVFGTQEQPGDVVIVVEGPPRNATVRKKNRVAGLWTNTDSRNFINVPSFYEMASATTLDKIAAPELLKQKRIGLENLSVVRLKGGKMDATTTEFVAALFQEQSKMKLFVPEAQPLFYPGPNLFKTQFSIPAIVAPGQYRVSAYLFSNGQIMEEDTANFVVVPEGLSAELRVFATENGLLYGLTGMFMALMAGWLATVLLKRD